MFSNSKNVLITGQNVNLIAAAQTIDEGLKILYEHAAPGALHDSGERFDPPNCHPGTRVEVQESIISWLDDADSEYSAMWMNGAMGAGKSAIGQAISQLCHERGQLSSSFFFARASAGRNDETRLVATLAYQMTIHIPETRSPISAAILNNPLIFQSSLKSQFQTLIIRPLSNLSNTTTNLPKLIIIDGLDECLNSKAQDFIVRDFVSSIASISHIPISHKILIISRPESNIDAAFRTPSISSHVKHLSLNELWKPDDDIRAFLVDSFEDIKGTHPLRKHLPTAWPPIGAINTLIRKSSGQFIYAAVVMRFLRSHRNHPIRSLDVILGLIKDTRNQPYAELDALYAHIFSKVNDLDLVLQILSVHLSLNDWSFDNDYNVIDDILDLPSGNTQLALNDLASAIQVTDEGQIHILHASLSEFLMNQARSGPLSIYADKTGIDVVNFALSRIERASSEEICPGIAQMKPTALSILIVQELMDHISLQGQITACEAIAEREIFAKITSIMATEPDSPFAYQISPFIEQIMTKRLLAPRELHIPLTRCFQQIKDWFQAQFSAFPFSGFDNSDSIDIWVFRSIWKGTRTSMTFPPIDLPPYCDPSTLSKLLTLSIHLCGRVLSGLPNYHLATAELLGEYSLTGSRYLHAALRTCRQLLAFTNQDFIQAIAVDQGAYSSIVGELLSDTPPNQELYIMLEPMTSEEPPATCAFPAPSWQAPSAATCRVYGYFWRKYQFEEVYYDAIIWLAIGISDYLEKMHEYMPEILCCPPPNNNQRVTEHEGEETRKRNRSPEFEDPSKRRKGVGLNHA